MVTVGRQARENNVEVTLKRLSVKPEVWREVMAAAERNFRTPTAEVAFRLENPRQVVLLLDAAESELAQMRREEEKQAAKQAVVDQRLADVAAKKAAKDAKNQRKELTAEEREELEKLIEQGHVTRRKRVDGAMSGFAGVTPNGRRWRASFRGEWSPQFDTIEEAALFRGRLAAEEGNARDRLLEKHRLFREWLYEQEDWHRADPEIPLEVYTRECPVAELDTPPLPWEAVPRYLPYPGAPWRSARPAKWKPEIVPDAVDVTDAVTDAELVDERKPGTGN